MALSIQEYEKLYWKNYLRFEKDLLDASHYVEICQKNLNTHSRAFLYLLLSIGSEFDNVCREAGNLIGRTNIVDYADELLEKYPTIINQKVLLEDFDLELTPFSGWNHEQASQTLCFWNDYNEVKHDRVANFEKATLGCVLNALAGLFILEMYRMNEIYMVNEYEQLNMSGAESSVFILDNWEYHLRTSNIKPKYKMFDDETGREM